VRPGRPPPPRPQDYCIHVACDEHIHHRCWCYYNTQTTTTITTTTTTTNSEARTTATTASTRLLHSRSLWWAYSPSLLALLQHRQLPLQYYMYYWLLLLLLQNEIQPFTLRPHQLTFSLPKLELSTWDNNKTSTLPPASKKLGWTRWLTQNLRQ